MPVIKQIPAKESANLRARVDYIRDAAGAAPGELCGPKVACAGIINGDDDWHGTLFAQEVREALCDSDGAKSDHWVMSLRAGETWTPETAPVAAAIAQRHLGYSGPAFWSVHYDTKNSHLHLVFPRIAEDENGSFNIIYMGGSECNPKSGHTYTHLSAAKAEAEIRALQGWSREKRAVYDFVDGQFIKAVYPKADPGKIRLGSRVEAYEAHHGKPHPKRILAEAAVAEIRAVTDKNKPEAIKRLTAAGITVLETDRGVRLINNDVPKGIKLSALPRDCRFLGNNAVPSNPVKKEPDTATHSGAKAYIKRAYKDSLTEPDFLQKLAAKNLVFEQTGKAGGRVRYGAGPADTVKLSEAGFSFLQMKKRFENISPYESNMPEHQEKINALSGKVHDKVHENSIIAIAPVILLSGQTKDKTLESLAAQQISLTIETGTDQKTGKAFLYGKLSRPGEKPVSLRQLGLSPEGRPLFSLPGLEKAWRQAEQKVQRQQLASDVARVFEGPSKTWAEAEQAFASQGMNYRREKITIQDRETGAEKQVVVGRIERDGVTITTGQVGPEFSISKLDAKYMPYGDAKNLYEQARLQAAPVSFLAAQGLTVSDIDRIGRVGEKAEKALQRKEKPSKAPTPNAPTRPVGKSVIPTSLREILDLIEESAQQAAQLARANAQAARANALADRAEKRALVAEQALAEIKASIPVQDKTKTKPEQPAEQQPEKEITMSDTNSGTEGGGAALAPEPKKKGWLEQHAEEALAAAHAFAATASPSGGTTGQEDEQQSGPSHGPRQ